MCSCFFLVSRYILTVVVFNTLLTWDCGGAARATVIHGPKEIKVQKSGTSTSLKFSDRVGRQPYRR